jgi:DNA-binding MarR family transcriptional regulator
MSDQTNIRSLSRFYKALGHRARIELLLRFQEGEPNLSDVADELGMARPSLQNHVEKLVDADLIFQPPDSGRTYELTPIGEKAVERVRADESELAPLFQRTEDAEAEARERFSGLEEEMEDLGLSTRELERKVNQEKWERFYSNTG